MCASTSPEWFDESELQDIVALLEQQLLQPVRIDLFRHFPHGATPPPNAHLVEIGEQAEQIVGQLARLSDLLTLHVHDYETSVALRQQLKIDKAPALRLSSTRDYGLRHYGVPYGYNFAAFLNSLIDVSQGRTELTETTRRTLHELPAEVFIRVFVGPSCPFCPIATHFAGQFALESDLVFCESINTAQFPELVDRYGIRALPTVLVNDSHRFVGLTTEDQFLQYIVQSVETVQREAQINPRS
jgi:glutaredoxin-like protein